MLWKRGQIFTFKTLENIYVYFNWTWIFVILNWKQKQKAKKKNTCDSNIELTIFSELYILFMYDVPCTSYFVIIDIDIYIAYKLHVNIHIQIYSTNN